MAIAESCKLINDLGGAESVSLVMNMNVRTIYSYKTEGIPLDLVDQMKRMALSHGVPVKPAFDRSDRQGGDHKSSRFKEKKHHGTTQTEK